MTTSKSSSRKRRRQSLRGQKSRSLARCIVEGKHVVFITGAGLSVASGVRQFRGESGLWSSVIWKQATREAFRKDPLEWYNNFWLPHFGSCSSMFSPNSGHDALSQIQNLFPDNVHIITQNIDGLQSGNVIEAHGHVGLYKCIPEEDSDTDSDSDEDDDRMVHLGSRRKCREIKRRSQAMSDDRTEKPRSPVCPFQQLDSILTDQVEPPEVRLALQKDCRSLKSPPLCPGCKRPCPPQALLFDEGYHSHDFYQFEKMEDCLARCSILVFVGTSFAVSITHVALDHAREHGIPVYNFNICDILEATARLNVENVIGPANKTLPRLLEDVKEQVQDSLL